MKTMLDDSHVSLIRDWATFQKMKRAADEIENYLIEVARSCSIELRKRYGPALAFNDDKLDKEHWFDAYPSELGNFHGMGIKLMWFGLEYIGVDSLTDPNYADTPCRAYAYTADDDTALWPQVSAFLATVPPPKAFSSQPVEQGYLYTAALPTLKPEDFADPTRLRMALCDPLLTLLDWYSTNKTKIQQFQPLRFRREGNAEPAIVNSAPKAEPPATVD